MNIKLTIQYDGTNYHGYQIQPNGITVQEVLENALHSITGENIRIIGCGRTDSGVHALNYVCNFHTESTIPPSKYCFALNSKFPPDIRCISSIEAPADFHAKNSAVKKTYIYRINNCEFANVFERNYSWHYKYALDLDKMRSAAKAFLGEHDFAGFVSSGFSVKTTVRTIYALDIQKNGDIITIEITGNGFLYNMVRIIAGTLVYAAGGRINPHDMADIIKSCDRTRAGITAPPQGLFMKEVYYPSE